MQYKEGVKNKIYQAIGDDLPPAPETYEDGNRLLVEDIVEIDIGIETQPRILPLWSKSE